MNDLDFKECINTQTILVPAIKEFSVSEVSGAIKNLVESNFDYILIRGEISGLKIATSGHGYFNLKDENSLLACTCWKNALSKVSFELKDGIEVKAYGRLTTYPGMSRYQLTVEKIEPSGIGALMQILEERKKKLAAEGLFDAARKKKIPFLPRIIGVITSPTGAVIRDIIHRVSDRCPVRIIIYPVSVQGENSANEVTAAIHGFNTIADTMKPDVIIVARGGGSIEDLWSFNDESVVRAVAQSDIPIVSAIGHETDVTLIDFAADLRAPTPTAAAEMVVPVLSELKLKVKNSTLSLENLLQNYIKTKELQISLTNILFDNSVKIFAMKEQKFDDLTIRLSNTLSVHFSIKSQKLQSIKLPKHSLYRTLQSNTEHIRNRWQLLSMFVQKIFDTHAKIIEMHSQLLDNLDYKQVQKRGFAIIRSDNGHILSSSLDIGYEPFSLELYDGIITAKQVKI